MKVTYGMHSKSQARSFSSNQKSHSSCRGCTNRVHVKTLVLVVAVLLVSIGPFLFSRTQVLHTEEGSSTSADSIAELNNTSPEDFSNSSSNLSQPVFLGVSELMDLSFFDSGSVTAIIPVTSSSINDLRRAIEPLISDQSSISAITLVCVAPMLPSLRTMLHEEHLDTFLDVNIALWMDGLNEGSAAVAAAAQVSTEYALIMDADGFGDLHEDSREQLLAHPLLLDVPTGFCGGRFTKANDHAMCAVPSSEPVPASFILPPFVIPVSLIRGFNSTMDNDADFWKNFGRTVLRANAIGAFVQESEHDSSQDWCRKQCQKYDLDKDDTTVAQCSSSSPLDENLQRARELEDSTSVSIILPTLGDLRTFSSVACSFSQKGYSTHVLILSRELDQTSSQNGSYPWLHENFISSACDIPYSELHSSSNDFANAEALSFWLDSTIEMSSVIFYSTGQLDSPSGYLFESILHRHSAMGVTVVRIPQSDMPYCDWIGSLSLAELRDWYIPDVEISVITDNRPNSLERLLNSLSNARYFGDSPSLRINVEQTADMDTRKLVTGFQWDHGDVFVHHRVVHAGLLTAIVESWYPRSNHSYGVLLEDDVEVSPFFYSWIKMNLLHYRYGNNSDKQSSLFGLSLYQQKQIELRPEGRRPFNAQTLFDAYGILHRNTPYLSQIPCSWGAVYFPEHWREFHAYLMVRFSEAWLPLRVPVVPHVRSNRWAKSWKRFFIELAFLRGYVMLYPNYDDFVSLSTNHLEIGSHVKEQPRSIYEQKKAMFTLPLLTLPGDGVGLNDEAQDTGLLELPDGHLPAWSDLPVLDLLGTLSSESELEERGRERQKDLVGCMTVGSQAERRRLFQAEELFTCSKTSEDHSEVGEGIDSRDSL